MELRIWTIVYKENSSDEWKQGFMIGSPRGITKGGVIISDKYFSLGYNAVGRIEIIPFNAKDMFEIGYCNYTEFKL